MTSEDDEDDWERLLSGGRRPPLVKAVSVCPTEISVSDVVLEVFMESGRAVIEVVGNDVVGSVGIKEDDIYPNAVVVD